MIPQVVIDCAENLVSTKVEHMKTNYALRLEAIRDYCDDMLKKANGVGTKPTFTPVRKKKFVESSDPNDARKWSS